MTLDANVRFVNGIAVVDMHGRLMFGSTGERLRDMLMDLFEQGHSRILLNLSVVQHVDSGGLGDLVAAHAAITRRGGTLKLAQPPDKVRNMLRMTHIDSLFETYDDEASGLASFGSSDTGNRSDTLTDFFNG